MSGISSSAPPNSSFGPVARPAGGRGLAPLVQYAVPRYFEPGRKLLEPELDNAPGIYLILAGFAARYLVLPSARRPIMALLLPGDFCDLPTLFGEPLDHSVGALSAVEAAFIPGEQVFAQAERFPELLSMLCEVTARDQSIARAWLLNVGQRSALQRMAHLLCEIFTRLRETGRVQGNACSFPITQDVLADMLALTPVHVNRMLMQLRRAQLIELEHHRLIVRDEIALRALAGFDPSYLFVGSNPTSRLQSHLRRISGSSE